MTDRPEPYRHDSKIDNLRIPPQSVEAEQSVLGGVMLAPDALALVADLLVEDDFYRRDHRLIWRAIQELDEKGKPFDAVTLGEWFEANNLDEQIGGTGYLIELASTTPSAANVRAYADIVADKATLRRMINCGTEMVNAGYLPGGRDVQEIVSSAHLALTSLTADRGAGGLEAPGKHLREMWNDLVALVDSDEELTGLSTPWSDFDDLTLGLQDGDLYVIGARPNMGKSIYAGDLAEHVANKHGPVGVYSLEMSRKQWLRRTAASIGKIPHDWLRSPKAYARRHCDDPDFSADDLWGRLNVAVRHLKSLPLYIDDTPSLTIEQIVARARRAKRQHGLRLVVLDHLHIVRLAGRQNQAIELGDVTRRLKALGKELNLPVVALAQLNRALKDRTDKRPTMTDLRASGDIEQDADDIWFLHRPDYYDKKTHLRRVVELINAKSRNAPAGETVHLKNRFDEMRMEPWVGPLPQPIQPDAGSGSEARGFGRQVRGSRKQVGQAEAYAGKGGAD